MFHRDGEFQTRLREITNIVDKEYKDADHGTLDNEQLKHDLLMIRINAQTLLHTIQKMSETLDTIESIEEDLRKELIE